MFDKKNQVSSILKKNSLVKWLTLKIPQHIYCHVVGRHILTTHEKEVK